MKIDFNDLEGVWLPLRFRGGLEGYFNDHIETGSFLRAVLENDLTLAVRCADPISKLELASIVEALIQLAPSAAWGSREAVSFWLSDECRAQQRRLDEIRGGQAFEGGER